MLGSRGGENLREEEKIVNQIQILSMPNSFGTALKGFVQIVREGGSYWGHAFPNEIEMGPDMEVWLLKAHLKAQDDAWERGNHHRPNLPELSFWDNLIRLIYTTCNGTSVHLEGRFHCKELNNWKVTVEGKEASVLRRALAASDLPWSNQDQGEMQERLQELEAQIEESTPVTEGAPSIVPSIAE
ncbi:MAG: hypothetical protein ABIP54_03430 [Candidatus Andersenbacteria bacterium]